MIEIILLVIAALIVLPITYWLQANKKVGQSSSKFILSGLIIALLGVFISKAYPFYYTVLIIFALTFVFSVIVDKWESRIKTVEKTSLDNKKDKLQVESKLESLSEVEESSAFAEDNEFIVENKIDEELKLSTSSNINEESLLEAEEVNHGK